MNNASSSSDNSDEILHVHYDYTSTCKDELTLKLVRCRSFVLSTVVIIACLDVGVN